MDKRHEVLEQILNVFENVPVCEWAVDDNVNFDLNRRNIPMSGTIGVQHGNNQLTIKRSMNYEVTLYENRPYITLETGKITTEPLPIFGIVLEQKEEWKRVEGLYSRIAKGLVRHRDEAVQRFLVAQKQY